ncbi:hypothetical protein MSG28_002140 [Choristoneura fumiferana]|uniref:Uncharacterized protein n=1 Tax=Choristoneura fumiferana TaxID=7141 RepID=A0ACC0JU00_CHOFU|nr:hypothetical protein MSG28_002140 [Choristoneura fumiferana]
MYCTQKDLIYKEKSAGLSTPHNISEINFNTSSEKESDLKSAGQNLICKEKFLGQDTLASIPENNITTSLENESSIIHTAKLMKASVFLSPTFISNNRGIIEGEVEILGSNKFVENAISMQQTCLNKEEYDQDYDYMIEGLKFPIQHKEAVTESNFENANDAKSSEAVQKTNKDVQLTDVHFEINKPAKDVKCDDHANEAYLSDSSNDTLNCKEKWNIMETHISNTNTIPTNNEETELNETLQKGDSNAFDTPNFYVNRNFLSSVSENVQINKQIQEVSSQHELEVHKSIFDVPVVLADTFNYEDSDKATETNVSGIISTKTYKAKFDEEKVNATLQKVNPNSLAEQDFNIDCSRVSSEKENIEFSTRKQEPPQAFEIYEKELDSLLVLPETLDCENSGNITETNISGIISTKTYKAKFDEEKVNATLQKVNPNSLAEQDFNIDCSKVSSEKENIEFSTRKQEPQQAIEIYEKELDSLLVLPETLDCENSGNITETNISGIISTKTYKAKFDEEKVNATLQKINPNSLDEQDFNIDCSKVSSEKENIEFSTREQEPPQAFEIYEKELDSLSVLPETLDCENSGNITETNISDTKTPNTIMTNYEEQKINLITEKINSSAVDEENFYVDDKHLKLKAVSDKVNTKVTTIKENCKKTSRDMKRKSGIFLVKDSKINSISKDHLFQTNVNKKKLNDEIKSIQVKKKILKRFRKKKCNIEIRDVLVQEKTELTKKSSKEIFDSCIVPDDNTEMIQYNNKSLSTSTADHSIHLGSLVINNEIEEDKIREIAGYLKKFAELQKRKKIFKEKQNISDIKIFSNKKHATNTKLSIQGVEKPGGLEKGKDRKCDKTIKTYERKRKYKSPVNVEWNTVSFEMLTQKIDLSTNTSFDTYKDTEFCLCEDFGRFIYYDEETMYEHIHFWNREHVDCTPDLVFSIYNENIPTEISDTNKLQNCSSIPIQSFCELDHEEKGNEHIVTSICERIENVSLNVDKPESSVDEQMKPDASKSSGSQAQNTENLHNKAMESLSLLENCQETLKNNIVSDMNSKKNEKKRKYSSTFNESDEPPLNQYVTESKLEAHVKSYKVVKKQKCSENEHTEKIVPGDHTDSEGNFAIPLNKDTATVCGVCQQHIKNIDWLKHIASQHNYLSWRADEEPLEYQRESVLPSSEFDSKSRPFNHSNSSIQHACVEEQPEPLRLVECGVCRQSIQDKDWNSHIESHHNYLAWKNGENTLDVDDDDDVKEHLNKILKERGGLKCAKCGLIRKYVKSYQTHIKSCDGENVSESLNEGSKGFLHIVSDMETVRYVSDPGNNISIDNGAELVTDDLLKCGVCGEFMRSKAWNSHIGSQHNYLAWRHGESALDVADEVAVKEHLYNIMKECGGLKCAKCGLIRKYVKSYQTHIRDCDGLSESIRGCATNSSLDVSEMESVQHVNDLISDISIGNEAGTSTDVIRCAVCGYSMRHSNWYDHIGFQHNYLAWRCGDPTLDFEDEEAVHKHLYAITKEYGGLKCVKCGLNRKYVKAYLTHVKSCTGHNIVQNNNWYNHIESKHKYLAWKYGEPALDVDNEEAVREHLNNITKEYGSLNCTKCGITRKYVKSYLTHVKSCSGRSTQDGNPIADDAEPNIVVLSEAEQHTGLTKCGVCGQYMPLTDWAAHIEGKHDYLAWKDGEPPLHIKKCYASEEAENSSKVTDQVIIWPDAGADQVKCGVCDELVQVAEWIKHIATQHDYLAKKVGETPLDVNDDEEVYVHLYNIVKENGSLACQKCGIKRKYVKSYLEHIRKCGQDESVIGDSTFETNTTLDTSDCLVDFYRGGTCGVCDKEVETGKWIQHIQKEHNYLAWRKGEKPWDLDDCTQVNEYLYEISKKMGGLTCNKCGLVRKYVKSYLTHIKSCNVVDFNLASIVPDGVGPVSDKAYRCAMCQKEIEPSNWKNHAMKEHYNITWIIGETPIDIKNPYAVEKYLKEYKQSNSLKCNNCGATRTSFAGFYAHIITCGKSEEQIEMFQSVCDICNNKYLCIYKNQHMMIHRVQSYNKELKMSKEKVKLVESGKRRAAQKARTVIETYNSDMSQHSHKCSTCGFGTDFKEELKSHRCDRNEKDFSEEESSVAEGEGSEDESADSEVDSDISREEEDQLQTLRKRCKEPVSVGSKLSKINFKVDDPNEFIEQSDIDFCNAFFTDETLFPKWISCKREIVSIKDLPKYLPPMEESCKVNAGLDWTTLKRFEAKSGDGTSIFVGASIVCVTWIPLRVEDIMGDGQNFLAIACHNDVDCPRYECDETVQHENLIQIWDFGTRDELPQIVYGIAHDFGTVWSMDWCPSGARDVLPEDLTDGRPFRLGLLAVACSNGSAYIFSVPHPSTVIENNRFIQKLKPVAELRMKMLVERSERKVYQATSVTWSKEKGHEVILVGYADGSTGYYDINNESPLSWRVEDEVDIFFPYSEERPHNTCVTATDIVPRLDGGFVSCSASPTGAEMSIPGAGVRVRSHLPARAAIFAPHWPATLLAGDIAISQYTTAITSSLQCVLNECFSTDEISLVSALDLKGRLKSIPSRKFPKFGGAVEISPRALEVLKPALAPGSRPDRPNHAALPRKLAQLQLSTAVNELEWTQPARKLGGIRALAGCARCGRVAAAAPPTLRVMRPHPAYPEFKKPIFGMIEMVPLANKRSKQVNDELAMKIEPLTYPETIIKYGIQFQSVNKCDKVLQQKYASKPKAHFPERFPLADVESMAFCPAKRYHDRLAVATHSGIVFITNVNL